jgi:hypothetical protein
MVSIFDNKFDSLNKSCGKVSDEISFSKSSDFRDKPVSSAWDSSRDNVKRAAKRCIEIFRSRILKRIDDMEEKLMLEVNTANSKIVAETQEEMKAV